MIKIRAEKGLEKLLLTSALVTGLTLGGLQDATNKAYAQTQKQTKSHQTEQEKEAGPKLIDYEKINLLQSDRVRGQADFYGNSAVFVADISEVNKDISRETSFEIRKRHHNQLKYEVFLTDENGENQKRLTYSLPGTLCFAPLFTPNGKGIVYTEMYLTEEYAKKHPEERFKSVGGRKDAFTNDYALIIGPFAFNPYHIDLSNGSKKRLKIEEDGRLRRERLKQKNKN
jgi:hypothetical protein